MRLVIFLLLGLALAGCDRQKAPEPQAKAEAPAAPEQTPRSALDRSHKGTPAPAIRFQDPSGATIDFARFRGKPLLVNLWATWCTPCIAELPTLDALAARMPGLQVLALSQDTAGKDKVDAFFAERRFKTLRPYLDAELGMMTALGAGTLPTTVLYDADGREVWRLTGIEDWNGAKAAELLREADGG